MKYSPRKSIIDIFLSKTYLQRINILRTGGINADEDFILKDTKLT